MQKDELNCPTCNSTNVEAKEKGFDNDSAAVGAVLFGGVGMLVAGYKDRKMVMIHCLDCKFQWNHNHALGMNYKTFKKEFYELYKRKEFVQAAQLYISYNEQEELNEDVHEIYSRMRSEDRKSSLIAIGFALFALILLIAFFVFDIQ
ncbi:hypothetical protein [Pedobacter sp. GR22-6]|uniref:hypothetical protein n=1 Tax=Pedobacter sp. GR22-6 TaxID=3127957 RepID=UPI00307E3285